MPKIPNWLKAGLYAALWAFLGRFLPALLGFLQDVEKWATDDGAYTAFPDPSVLVKAGVSAISAAMVFVIAAGVRLVQSKTAAPGEVPKYS